MLNPPVPQLAPMIRARLKERIPGLLDEDLPTHAVSEDAWIATIVRRTQQDPETVRVILYEVGVFVAARPATGVLESRDTAQEASSGSGIPDDTAQSGMMTAD